MNLNKYLPERSEYSNKFAEALAPFEGNLYVVGSAARKFLYNLGTTVNDYDFVFSHETAGVLIADALTKAFPDKVKETKWGYVVDCEVFTAKVKVEPIDQFLMGVRFAGDGLAVNVGTGRPLVIPEYMTLPPIVTIIETPETSDQNEKAWVEKHVEVLNKFQEDLMAVVSKSLTPDEPAKS